MPADSQQCEEPTQQIDRARRATANVEIDRNDRGDGAGDSIAAGENATVERAIADRDDPFRIRRCLIGALERLAHVAGDGPRDEQHIRMARRGDEAKPETLEIIEGVVERVDFELAPVAGACVDLADRKAAAETAACRLAYAPGELLESRLVGPGRGLGQRAAR